MQLRRLDLHFAPRASEISDAMTDREPSKSTYGRKNAPGAIAGRSRRCSACADAKAHANARANEVLEVENVGYLGMSRLRVVKSAISNHDNN